MRTLASLAFALLLLGCGESGTSSSDIEMLATESGPGVAGARLSAGPDGRLTLAWSERRDEAWALRYATVSESGLGPARDVVIEPRMFANWADLPSVTHINGSHWAAHWLRYSADKTYSYDVVLSQSFDAGTTWSEPLVVHDDGTETEHGFVSVYSDGDGVGLVWLDGRDTARPSTDDPLSNSMTLRAATVDAEGTLSNETVIDDSVCDCCQTDVAITPTGTLAVYRDRTAAEIRDIYVTRNSAGTWQDGRRIHADDWNIPGCPVNGPSIVADGDDVAIAWFSAARDEPIVRVLRSTDGGESFSDPVAVAAGRLAGFVGLAQLPENRLAVSWVARRDDGDNELQLAIVKDSSVDLPRSIATIPQMRVFPQLGYQDGSLYLAWTEGDRDTGELRVARVTNIDH